MSSSRLTEPTSARSAAVRRTYSARPNRALRASSRLVSNNSEFSGCPAPAGRSAPYTRAVGPSPPPRRGRVRRKGGADRLGGGGPGPPPPGGICPDPGGETRPRRGTEAQPPAVRVQPHGIEVGPDLIGVRAVEHRSFHLEASGEYTERRHAVADVGEVLCVMAQRRYRIEIGRAHV